MNEEQLQAYLDKECPDLELMVNTERGTGVLVIDAHIGFHVNLAPDESIKHVKDRLISGLADVIHLTSHDIRTIAQGETK